MALTHGPLSNSGYAIGDLYAMLHIEARARGIDFRGEVLRNNRSLFADVGVPMATMISVSPILIMYRSMPDLRQIKTDYAMGLNLPPHLSATSPR